MRLFTDKLITFFVKKSEISVQTQPPARFIKSALSLLLCCSVLFQLGQSNAALVVQRKGPIRSQHDGLHAKHQSSAFDMVGDGPENGPTFQRGRIDDFVFNIFVD